MALSSQDINSCWSSSIRPMFQEKEKIKGQTACINGLAKMVGVLLKALQASSTCHSSQFWPQWTWAMYYSNWEICQCT